MKNFISDNSRDYKKKKKNSLVELTSQRMQKCPSEEVTFESP